MNPCPVNHDLSTLSVPDSLFAEGERLARKVERVEMLKADKRYREADDLAWSVLRELGITDYQVLKRSSPEELLDIVSSELHGVASRMLCECGLSYKFRRENYHLHAIRFLEDAVLFDRGNIKAILNLTDLCVEVSPERFHPYIGRRETGYPTGSPEQEILREWELGFTLLQSMLEEEFGITAEHLRGESPLPKFRDEQDEGYALWAVSNLGRIMLHIGRQDRIECPANRGEPFFSEAAECAGLVLDIVGLPRKRLQIGEALDARLRSGHEPFGRRTRAVAEAFSLLGTVSESRGDVRQALSFFRLASEVDDTLRYVQNRVQALSLWETHGVAASPAARGKRNGREGRRGRHIEKRSSNAAHERASWCELRAQQPEALDGRASLAVERALSNAVALRPVLEQFLKDVGTLKLRGAEAEQALLDEASAHESRQWETAFSAEGFLALLGVNVLLEQVALRKETHRAARAEAVLAQYLEIEEAAACDRALQELREKARPALETLLHFG